MRTKKLFFALVAFLMMIAFLLSSCSGMAGVAAIQVWIDQPLDGSTFAIEDTITLQAHARDVNGPGIVEVQFFFNGENLVSVTTNSSESLVNASTAWRPSQGEFTIIAKATNQSGSQASSQSVHITVIGPRSNGPEITGPSVTPTFTPTTKISITPTFTPTGTKRPLTPTFTPTPILSPTLNLSADNYTLGYGGCTVIRWNSSNASSLTLNGESVSASGERDTCPLVTTTYTLNAQSSSGQIERSITLEVIPPPTPPCPSGRTSSLAYISIPGGNCSTHYIGETFTLCFGLNSSSMESIFTYTFQDFSNTSPDGSGNPTGSRTDLYSGTFSSEPVCKNVAISEPTGLEAVKLVISSNSYDTSEADYPIVWIKVVP